jgi:hypothetical protein
MAKATVHSKEQVKAFVEEVKTQSDRGTAIVATAILDELLALIISARFIELSSERRDTLFTRMGAPLSSFSAKIEVAFALRTINNDARLALHLLRDVRNKFAHRVEPLTFDHPEVAKIIEDRVSEVIKKAQKPLREQFLGIFSALTIVLYGTLAGC